MSAPDVAVVIPAYRAGATIARALGSVLAQTLAPAEVLVVDDGSDDETAEVAREVGGERVRVVTQSNAGPGAARNRGVAETTAPWIAFLDADDRWLPEKLERELEVVGDAPAIGCDAFVVGPGGRRRKNGPSAVRGGRLAFDDLLVRNPLICSSVVVARAAFDAVGGFDEERELIATEDWDLWLRLAERAPIRYLDAPLLEYDGAAGSLGTNERFLTGVDRILAKHADRLSPAQRVLADARRASARLDLAYDLVREGEGARARALLADARRLGAGWGRSWRTWMRSWLA